MSAQHRPRGSVNFPQSYDSVRAAAGKLLAVGAPANGRDWCGVFDGYRRDAGWRPDTQRPVGTGRCQPLAVGTPRDAEDRRSMALQLSLRSTVFVPQMNGALERCRRQLPLAAPVDRVETARRRRQDCEQSPVVGVVQTHLSTDSACQLFIVGTPRQAGDLRARCDRLNLPSADRRQPRWPRHNARATSVAFARPPLPVDPNLASSSGFQRQPCDRQPRLVSVAVEGQFILSGL